jgi:DNA-binding beta-propeller fold protein YncE
MSRVKTICRQFVSNARRRAWSGLAAVLATGACCGQTAAPTATALGSFSHQLRGPIRVAADSAGRIYVSDRTAGQVLVFDAFGRPVSAKAGLAAPLAVAVDSSARVYVGEEQNGSVSVFDAQWNLLFQLGQGDGEFALPSHIALDPATGTAFVCDSAANRIKCYREHQLIAAFGGYGTSPGQFDLPAGVWASAAGEVYVVDQNNNRVQVFDRTGSFQRQFPLNISGGGGGLGSNVSGRSQGITGDTAGHVYVADSFQGLVQVFDAQGNHLSTIGGYGDKSGQFRLPLSLAIDACGRLLVASANNRRIELIGLDSFVHLAASPAAQWVAAGAQANFAASLSGPGPFTYQWRKGTYNLSDTSRIHGSTEPTLVLTAATTADTGSYSVVVIGPSGTFTSPDATLTVITPPVILSQPSSQTVTAGAEVVIGVAAVGDSLTCHWQHDGSPLVGPIGPSLTIPTAQAADAGRYTVVLSNCVGVVASEPALLTVVSRPNPPQLDPFAFQPDGSLRIFFQCDPGFTYAIEASTDLVEWATLATAFNADGAVEYFDTDAASISPRFYRARWLP